MSHDSTRTETEAAFAADGGTSDGAAWAWVTEHRAPQSASTAQLVSWFARGELPPYTLVWKRGWGEWLPAMQVAELAAAFPSVTPGSRRVARAVLRGAVTAPPVPVAAYPRLRLLAKDVLADGEVTPFTALPAGLAPAPVGRRVDPVQQDWATSQVPSSGYGAWLLGGTLLGGALGLLSIRGDGPQAAAPTEISALTPALPPAPERTPRVVGAAPRALSVAAETLRVAPAAAKKPAGVVQVKRSGEPAVLHALRSVEKDGFDRVVFEFRERMPGYHIAYVEKPVRNCGSGGARRIDGNARLELRFSPASAHTERGEATVRERELKPALSMVREIERTCDFEGIVTFVIGTASPHHYRAFELTAPPRLVVDIDR